MLYGAAGFYLGSICLLFDHRMHLPLRHGRLARKAVRQRVIDRLPLAFHRRCAGPLAAMDRRGIYLKV
jgi:hypothetical protein